MIDHWPELHMLRHQELIDEAEAVRRRRAARRARTTPFNPVRRMLDAL